MGTDSGRSSVNDKAASAGASGISSWAGKALLLSTLVLQNCACGILVRQTRIRGSGEWVPQTGVLLQEVLKGLVSLGLAVLLKEPLSGIVTDPRELLVSAVPALLYLVQNNLQYVALGYLEPAAYTVTYQLKIVSTAGCFVLMLGKKLSIQSWISLMLLVLGVCLVQLATLEENPRGPETGASIGRQAAGVLATLLSSLLSGIAGVYTEMILKNSKVSLWGRNVQLAAWSTMLGLVGLASTGDLSGIQSRGFFHGYNGWICASICNNAFGGLIIAAVIRYADNILKNFATSVSIVLTTVLSVQYFGLELNLSLLLGVALVCYSIFLYSGVLSMPFSGKAKAS
ncbi:unnamed protein product [Polarella glacialis]|uniref:UDP-N-acetylglucosamine transporter n=1 Tax=Polarella glacialis TaxID=89957 RepID=A0A813JGW8_POLGL|nr:unnamed protein product [Polarella glacialis]